MTTLLFPNDLPSTDQRQVGWASEAVRRHLMPFLLAVAIFAVCTLATVWIAGPPL